MFGVTVLIPTYKPGPFLPTLINSIVTSANEAGSKVEIQVFDDGSPDGSSYLDQLESEFVNIDLKVHRWEKKERAGSSSAAYTKALLEINPKYSLIALADHDDIWLPNRISRILQAFNNEFTILYAGTSLEWDSSKSNPLNFRSSPGPRGKSHVSNFQLDQRKCIFEVSVSTHNIVILKDMISAFAKSPLTSHDIALGVEFDNYLPALASFVGPTYVDLVPTLIWRQHVNNASGNFSKRFTLKGFFRSRTLFIKEIWNGTRIRKYVAVSNLVAKGIDFKCDPMRLPWSVTNLQRKDFSSLSLAFDKSWRHWNSAANFLLRIRLISYSNKKFKKISLSTLRKL